MKKRLFYDIETTFNIGWFFSTGYKVRIGPEQILEERKIAVICYKWEGDDEVHYLTWDKNRNDKKMLKKFMKIANKADELVAHNGDNFDIKFIKTRCIYHGIDGTPLFSTIDTLKICRKNFRFNSNKLDYVAQFLNVGGKIETGGFQLWKDLLLGNDKVSKKALEHMVKYCKNDVIILEKVFNKLKNYTPNKIHFGSLYHGNKISCPECGSINLGLNKTYTTKTGIVRHYMRCNDCRKVHTVSNTTYEKIKNK